MYGQGSYNSQSGRVPPPPLRPPYQQQLPRPTPLPPHFHQAPPNLPPPPLFQRGSPNYQHGPPPIQHPAVREVPQGAAVANSSQPYVHQQPSAHGSTQLPQIYSTDQQNGHLPSHVGTQNVHHMLRGIPPHPPRVLPPPPTNNYRTSAQQQSQRPNRAQDLPPPPPPPPISSTFTSSPIGSFVQSMSRNSAMHLPPPPPLNYSMSASAHQETASNLSSSNKPLCSETSTPDFFDKDVSTDGLKHNVSHNDELSRQDGPIAPPKPTEEKVVQKIEDFCLLIAKNGPGYEDWVCQNESGNPEFEFLFSGDPGSEAAIEHEFFLWTKKKVMLACKLNERSESLLRPSGTDSPMQSNHLEVESRTYSPADSDMEMEDDITQPSNDPCVDHSTEVKGGGCGLIHSDLDVKELLHEQQILESENDGSDVPVTLVQEKVVSIPDLLALEASVSTVYSSMISSDNEYPTYIEKSATTSVGEKFPSGASPASQGVDSEKKSSQLIKGGSAFGDVSGNDSEKQPESVSPLKVSSSVAVGASSQVIGLHFSPNAVNFHVDSGRDGKEELGMASMTNGTSDEKANQADSRHAKSPPEFYKKYVSEDAGVETCLNGNFQKESAEKGAKAASNSIKVDEFGRLVREGASESDSDDSRYNGRRGKRGRSRSRSPLERRRRRSPRRRRKRSRSRSLSPIKRRSRSRSSRNQRSRSRSPRNRRSRSRSPRNRRSRSRSPRRWRNSRSPAQRHVGEFSGNGMRRDRAQIPGCFDFRLGRCFRGASCRYVHHDSEKVDGSKHHRSKQQHLEVPPISRDSNFQEEIKRNTQKESNQQHDVVKMQLGPELPGSFDQDSQSVDPHTVKSATFKLHGDTSESGQNILMMPSQSKLPEPLLQNASCPPQRTDISYMWDSRPEPTSVHNVTLSEAVPSSFDFRHHSAQLPPPLAFSQGVTAPSMTQAQGDYNLTPQSMSFTCQSASGERFPYMLPSQKSNFYSPPIPSWTVLPPPPSIVPSQIKPYAVELPTSSQAGAFQQQSFPPMQEANRSISHSEDSRLQNLPPYNRQSKQFIGHGPLREDQLTDLSTLGLSTSSSFPQGDHQHVPQPFSRELSTRKFQTSFADNFPPTELFHSPLQIHPQLQQQQLNNSGQQSASVSSSSQFLPDLQEVKKSFHLPDLRVSRNSSSCDPSASNIEQPLSSKFSSEDLRQDQTAYSNKYASPFNMSDGQVDVTETGSGASRKAASSPNSAKAIGQNFGRSGGDQYDPLLDSFEPSSNISKETKNVNKWEPSSDSDILLRDSGLNKPLDVEANNKKEIGNLDVATATFNEDYGESAYAEVDAVENESPGSPTDAANKNEGDIEIDQTMSPSKNKNKESRSMKLFRVALADFVKEVLKPSWRQGNMSKEAFKTIVKKTVDKVAGAMKSHQIPKSQGKIDHYIASSERKLTKLVTGYVDKYVKM